MRAVAARAGLVVLLAIAGCHRDDGEDSPSPVVIVSIDTLRSDHLPVYGYGGVETPALDALRRDSVLVAHAYTHVPLTLPAHASLLTGLLPPAHQIRDNSGYRLGAEAGHASLASILRAAGYATGAAVSAYVLRAETGLDAGFDLYDDEIDIGTGSGLADQQRSGMDSLRATLPWLREASARGPFLYWLHLYEPHTPYEPPEPFRSRYASAPYDGEIAAADAVLGELVTALREIGKYEQSLVVILSDHGEGLGDHGESEHGILLYREVLEIPLLLKLPGNERAGDVVAAPAQLVDVLPTILDAIGLERPAGLPGRSILEPLPRRGGGPRDDAPIYAETYYPRLHHGWSELRSAIDRDLHYIEGPSPELYRLSDDPAERRNLVEAEPRAAAALAEAIARVSVAPAAPATEDAETRRRLQALGYLSGAPRGPLDRAAVLPDPKTQLPALAALEEAQRLFASGELDAARSALERLVDAQPRMTDGWETLGDVLESGGDPEPAIAARRRAIETSGGAPEQLLKLAPLLVRVGRLEEASEHARLAVDAFPAIAHTLLARIAMASGDLEEAEREARAAFASRSGEVTPALTLAEVLAARGDASAALAVIAGLDGELRSRSLPDPRPFLLRAQLLRERGDLAGAERALADASQLTDRLLSIEPSAPVGLAARARIADLRGDREPSAEAALERALSASDTGDQERARQILLAALERAPEQAPLHEALGLIELRSGDARAARARLERSIVLDAASANAWNLLGVARWQGARDGDGAIAAWQRALELDPTRWEALYNVARVASETGRREVARDALERFIADAPVDRYADDLAAARAALARLEVDGSGPSR
jgi:arylsulfatase A-like enzyme/predicted Zn-dependent protease